MLVPDWSWMPDCMCSVCPQTAWDQNLPLGFSHPESDIMTVKFILCCSTLLNKNKLEIGYSLKYVKLISPD